MHAPALALLSLACLSADASAQEWGRFRGPGGSGVRRDARLPATFSASDVRWCVPVGGSGHSSPVLLGDRVILTREGQTAGQREVVAFSAVDGALLWSHADEFETIPQHSLNSHAASTPAVDGSGVYVSWTVAGRVTALALAPDGALGWSRDVGPFEAQHGGGNSPVLAGDLLIIANEHEGPNSFLTALDKHTGETRWVIERESLARRGSYAAPVSYAPNGGDGLLLFASTRHGLVAVDPVQGAIAWELDLGFDQRFVGIPAITRGHALLSAGSGGGGKQAAIVRLPTGPGVSPAVVHSPRRNLPYVPGHLALGDCFYPVSDGGIASCIDAESGEVRWSERLDGTFFSSPVSDGETIWIASREGQLFSLASGSTFDLLGAFDLGEPVFATPALGKDRMFVRTAQHLLCLGAEATAEHEKLRLWPEAAPDEPAGMEVRRQPASTSADGRIHIRYVDEPTITVYRAPEDLSNGCCIVVAPGGGYNMLAWTHEGLEVAEWLNGLGVTAVLLEYRVPRRDPRTPHLQPLQDAQRAIRLTRLHASEWGIDPARVGMLGFSAGGHLTLAAGTNASDPSYPKVDEADELSARPDFLLPIYAAYLSGRDDPTRIAPEIRLASDTPPTFMAVTLDDQARGVDAARVMIELQRLGVECELHVFSRGGHGYGLRDTGHPVNGWPRLSAEWLGAMGWLDASHGPSGEAGSTPPPVLKK